MIKVLVGNKRLVVEGHANYAGFGYDIVCSAVSATLSYTIALAEAREDLQEEDIIYEENRTIINNIDKETSLIIPTFISMMEQLSKMYSKNIQVFYLGVALDEKEVL